MSDLLVINVNTLLRLSNLIYFYIDKRKILIECDSLVCYVIIICDMYKVQCLGTGSAVNIGYSTSSIIMAALS